MSHTEKVSLQLGRIISVVKNESEVSGFKWIAAVSSGLELLCDNLNSEKEGRLGQHEWIMRLIKPGMQMFHAEYLNPSNSRDCRCTYTLYVNVTLDQN